MCSSVTYLMRMNCLALVSVVSDGCGFVPQLIESYEQGERGHPCSRWTAMRHLNTTCLVNQGTIEEETNLITPPSFCESLSVLRLVFSFFSFVIAAQKEILSPDPVCGSRTPFIQQFWESKHVKEVYQHGQKGIEGIIDSRVKNTRCLQ